MKTSILSTLFAICALSSSNATSITSTTALNDINTNVIPGLLNPISNSSPNTIHVDNVKRDNNSSTSFAFNSMFSSHTIEPLSSVDPSTIYEKVHHPLPVSRYSHLSSRVTQQSLPTNAWFQNIILEKGDMPIVPLPYTISLKTESQCITSYNQLNYQLIDDNIPHQPSCIGSGSIYGLIMSLPRKQSTTQLVITPHIPDVLITANQQLSHQQVTEFDELSVKVEFKSNESSNGGNEVLTFPIVRGSPYITAIYSGTSILPSLSTIHAIMTMNDATVDGNGGTITGKDKLKFTLNNGQTYVVYSSIECNWKYDVNHISVTDTVDNRASLSEILIRVAVLTNVKEDSASTCESILDRYRSTYAIGANVGYGIVNDQVNLNYEWKTRSMDSINHNTDSTSSNGSNQLLMLALPHQQSTLISMKQSKESIHYNTVKGIMQGIVGSHWQMSMPALQTEFKAEHSIASHRIDDIKIAIRNDTSSLTLNSTIDPYTFGKDASKLARIILIADELNMIDERDIALSTLKPALIEWLTASNSDVLQYDSTYGGLCSKSGLADRNADYGQAWYNDHHFHYGYIVYACAIVSKYESEFVNKYKESMLMLVRDYANPSINDPYFTQFRHFDAYDGHSWASGLFAFGDSRNQESSSEAINSYYAVRLLGLALNDQKLAAVGQLLMTLETHGVNRYWHMTNEDSVYPSDYSSNKCVGMVWGTKVVDATWFASGPIYVHGIQMLPFTPITEHYLPSEWVQQQYPVMLAGVDISKPTVGEAWLGFMHGELAVVDSDSAWNKIQKLTLFDNGNSRSNMLYWCATRKN